MENLTLDMFIGSNRDELIGRCRAKVAGRSSPSPTEAEIDRGVPLFLNQLVEELRHGASETQAITQGAASHGHDLLLQGFTIGQVVHDYGDICQAITDLALERGAAIGTDEFRTLNRCLDDAIAGAVTEFSRAKEVNRNGESDQLRNLTDTAVTAFEVLQSGNVGVGGSTGMLVHRTLVALRDLVNLRPHHQT